MNEHVLIRRLSDTGKWRWVYSQEAADRLVDLYREHGNWIDIARILPPPGTVTRGNLSVFISALRKRGFAVDIGTSPYRRTQEGKTPVVLPGAPHIEPGEIESKTKGHRWKDKGEATPPVSEEKIKDITSKPRLTLRVEGPCPFCDHYYAKDVVLEIKTVNTPRGKQ